jgi:hypothetical protein
MKNLINICCSGSSGSTLLVELLNRHPEIACGDEIGLLSKPIIYNNFKLFTKSLKLIRKVGISSSPFFCERTILRSLKSYKLSEQKVFADIKLMQSINELLEYLYESIFNITGKAVWAEKTPENAYYIAEFTKKFPDSKIIHIVRDPRDVIMSLMNRGLSINHAAMNWLTAVSSVKRIEHNNKLIEIKYEDLVNNPKNELKKICDHLKVDFSMKYFLESKYCCNNLEMSKGHKSWTMKSSESISNKAVGKYKQSKIDFSEILEMRLTENAAKLFNINKLSIRELMQNYEYPENDIPNRKKALLKKRSAGKINKYNYKQILLHFLFKKKLEEKTFFDLVEY